MYATYDHVELTEPLAPTLPAGTRGAIVIVYPGRPSEYEVEFVNQRGETIAIRTVKEHQLRKVGAS